MISLVTAKVIRANAQYAYKLKGKGEKYLVEHNEDESAADKIVRNLTPYTITGTTVSIESVVVQKSSEVLDSNYEDCPVYKCTIRGEETTDEGRIRKYQRKYFIQALDPVEAIEMIHAARHGTTDDYEILSVAKTNIIEIK